MMEFDMECDHDSDDTIEFENVQDTSKPTLLTMTFADMAKLEKEANKPDADLAVTKFEEARKRFLIQQGMKAVKGSKCSVEDVAIRQGVLLRTLSSIDSQVEKLKKAIAQTEADRTRMNASICSMSEAMVAFTTLNNESYQTFSWPELLPAELESFIPKIEANLTDEAKFAKAFCKIISTPSPRKHLDACIKFAIRLCESVETLKRKRDGIQKKITESANCSEAEITTSKAFIARFDANIKSQTQKLELVQRLYQKSCMALINLANNYYNKFYEVAETKGYKLKRPAPISPERN